MNKNNLIFVDCEAYNKNTGEGAPCIGKGDLTEFGAVHYPSMKTFYGDIPKWGMEDTFIFFDEWLKKVCEGIHPIFVSDNPAFDFPWINYHFHHIMNYNPFGWSARRIGDYYAGLCGNFRQKQHWKKLRITKHDHNPVHDALGNAEAFLYIEQHKDEIMNKREK